MKTRQVTEEQVQAGVHRQRINNMVDDAQIVSVETKTTHHENWYGDGSWCDSYDVTKTFVDIGHDNELHRLVYSPRNGELEFDGFADSPNALFEKIGVPLKDTFVVSPPENTQYNLNKIGQVGAAFLDTAKESYDKHIAERKEIEITKERESKERHDQFLAEFAPVGAPEPKKYEGAPRTLDLKFDRQNDGSYTFKEDQKKVAFVDKGDKVTVKALKSEDAVRASLELAQEKFGDKIQATGSESGRRKAWLVGSEMGLTITGFEPTEKDKKMLENRLQNAKENTQKEDEQENFLSKADDAEVKSENHDDLGKAADDFFAEVENDTLGVPAAQPTSSVTQEQEQKKEAAMIM